MKSALSQPWRWRGPLALTLGLSGCTLLRPLDDLEGGCPEGCEDEVDVGPEQALEPLEPRCDAGCSEVESITFQCDNDQALLRFNDGLTFCIDRHEVTQQRYARFLDADPSAPELAGDAICADDVDRRPADEGECSGTFSPDSLPDSPVSCVDLCDARAYCAWAGKHLCGGRGGELLSRPRLSDRLDRNEWYVGCAGLRARRYPYGTAHLPGACNEAAEAPAPVGRFEACRTPEGVFDLGGNLAEWTFLGSLPINPESDGTMRFAIRGGSFESPVGVGDCPLRSRPEGDDSVLSLPWFSQLPSVGFRCCSDATAR